MKTKNEKSSLNDLMVVKNNDQVLIDARLLHQKLQSGYHFHHWIATRIIDFGFKQNEDYFKITATKKFLAVTKGGGHNKIDYHITMDMAKELAMLERNDIGRAIRRYFIATEREYHQTKALPTAFIIPKGIDVVEINNRRMMPYREFLKIIGQTNPGGSAYSRQKNYSNHFVIFNKKVYVSEELAQLVGMSYMVFKRRKVVKEMQPVLPLDFSDNKELPIIRNIVCEGRA